MKISKEVKVGLLTVIALVVLVVGFRFMKGIDFFDPSNTYYVIYDNVDGLTPSNPVEVNGYRVGRVNKIKLLQDGATTRILVSIEIDEDLTLYQGTEAILKDGGLLGNRSILLNIKQGGRELTPEDTLISLTDKSLTEMIRDRADPIVAEIDTTLIRVNNILTDLSRSGGKVDRTISEVEETATSLKYMVMENRRDINAITSNLRELSVTLNDPRTGLAPFMVKMNQVADSLNDMQLKETVTNANQAVQNLQAMTQDLQNGQGTLGKLLYNDSLYANLNQSTESIQSLIEDIKQNPGRYINLRFSLIGGGK